MIKNFFDKTGIIYSENASLKKYNTYRIDATCAYLVFPKNIDELITIIKYLKEKTIKYLILGNGSNIILSKEHYDYVIIKLDKLNNIEYHDNIVVVGSGYSLSKLAIETINKGLDGLTFAAGIPGCVGASTAMNAGAYNSDMASVVKEVKVLDKNLNIVTLNNQDLQYEYRDSFLKKHPEYIVLETTFELSKNDPEIMKNIIDERRKKRMASQPLDLPNAGSVFRNPENMYAGELIEKSNLKGFTVGGASVSEKHANFIVNTNNAKGIDVVKLIKKVKKEVKNKYNVELKLEQIIID